MVLILPIYTMLVHSEFRIIPDPAMLAQQQPKKKNDFLTIVKRNKFDHL
jgi:hypothetical protein